MCGHLDSRSSQADCSDGQPGRTSDVISGDLRPFEQQLANDWPVAIWQNLHIVLAVSGGADSVALLRAILAIKRASGGTGQVYVGHYDHGLRGDAGHADADWVVKTCKRLIVPVDVERADVRARAADLGDGIEAAARMARYDFLLRVAEKVGARFVVTAHTADDQAETVLHRILRGTGLAGLAGIPISRALSKCVTLIRPLLAVSRGDVFEYLEGLGQGFRQDSSNLERVYTRNWIRHEILPAIREHLNSDVDRALIRLAGHAAETQAFMEEMATSIMRESTVFQREPTVLSDGDVHGCTREIHINCRSLARQRQIIVREVCRAAWKEAGWPQQAMGAKEWGKLALLAAAGAGGSINLPSDIGARRQGEFLILARL